MTNMVHVPLELALLIIESAGNDPALLSSCSLVCRDWAGPAQRLLFKQVSLKNQAGCDAFLDAVSNRKVLADSVSSLRVAVDHNQPAGVNSESFAQAVARCPNLSDLSLSVYGPVSVASNDRVRQTVAAFDQRTLDILKAGPSITSLQFNNCSDDSRSLLQLLTVWPALKSLSISGTAPELPSPSSEPFPSALNELHMNFQTPPSAIFLKWLLHNSSDSLRVLGFAREPPAEVVEHLIDAYGSTLESVFMPTSTHAKLVIPKCPNLTQFGVEKISTSTAAPFRTLSPQLTHLAFGIDKDTSLLPLLDVVKSRQQLKSVTVQVWHGGKYHPQLASLQIACACRGISLEITQDITMFRSMMRTRVLRLS